MFRHVILLSCITCFSYTIPQVTNMRATNNYFDSLRQDLEIRPACLVNFNKSHTLGPCNRPIPPNVAAVEFVYDFQMFLCMGVYESILRVCDMDKKLSSTDIQKLLTSEETVGPKDFCERLQNTIEILNGTYIPKEWVIVLKQNLHDADACHRVCIANEIEVNPLCSLIHEATVILNSQESRNGAPAIDNGSNKVGKEQQSPIISHDNKNDVVANKPAPVPSKKEEINQKNRTVGGNDPEIKNIKDVGIQKMPTTAPTQPVKPKNDEVPMANPITNNQENSKPREDDNTNVSPGSPKKNDSSTVGSQLSSNSADKFSDSKNDNEPVPTLSPNSGGGQVAPQIASGAKDGKPNPKPSAGGEQVASEIASGAKDGKPNPKPSTDKPVTLNSKDTTNADTNEPHSGSAASSSSGASSSAASPSPSSPPHTDPKELSNETLDTQLPPGIQPFPGTHEKSSVIEQTVDSDGDFETEIDETVARGKYTSKIQSVPGIEPSIEDFETEIDKQDETVVKGKDTSKIQSVSVIDPSNGETPGPQGNDVFVDNEDSHFFVYFGTIVVLCIIGYLAFHNKQKILALTLEGHSRRNTRRRKNTTKYRKLDSNLEEAVTSSCKQSTTNIIY